MYYNVVAPNLLSDFERVHFFHGVSVEPPQLVWRSDINTNPFPVPGPGCRFFEIAIGTVEGVFDTPLNPKRGIKYSALMAVRFSTRDDDKKKTLGPITLWISTYPKTITPEQSRDASPHILRILQDHGVAGAVTQCLMPIADYTNPTSFVRRTLTPALGLPLAIAEREAADAQGSLGFYFHENKHKDGERSPKVFGVSCSHVLRANTTVNYQFPGLHMLRFQETITEVKKLIEEKAEEATGLAEDISRSEMQVTNEDEELAAADKRGLKITRSALVRVREDGSILKRFLEHSSIKFSDITARDIGHVDFAPKISVTVDELHYTRDFATFELNPAKFRPNFLGNVIDFGNKWSTYKLNKKFWLSDFSPTGFTFPFDRPLKVKGAITRELLASPDCFDDNGDPMFIVGKEGSATGFTMGHYCGLEAYICAESGEESVEVAVYNYSWRSGNFSEHGDSGSLIWTGDGRMVD
ncbi:hypothetical protein BDZ94DRAFT_1283951 [Collybia nuda]|uniref:Uncharacterized protein n=1 Tax=Collybia nuda TaxID=64659 RepID=A0A9P5Y125_9AGAR|nr:hypothetical protein BDZ94DRAFT_1283951 [Collybia nuda]